MKTKAVDAHGDTAGQSKRKRTVEDSILKIDELIGQQKRTVFEIGDLLVSMQAEMPKSHFRNAVKGSGLRSMQTANNYMRVAKAEHLRKPDVFPHLPTTVGALIDLACWKDWPIERAIQNRIIHPQSERSKLRKWLHEFDLPPKVKQKSVETDQIVGYIMCDIATYDYGRIERLQEQFDNIKLQHLDDDVYISPLFEDELGHERLRMLGKRVWDAYESDQTMFPNPAFHDVLDRHKITSDFSMYLHLSKIAPLIASSDHKALHKVIKFSKSDWKRLGVEETGYATLLAYFGE